MAYIITRLCRDCLDTGCVAVCPVDCIYEYTGSNREEWPNQLYIHPDECIDCGACEPECPWNAIFEEVAVPEVFKDDTPLNYKIMEHMGDVKVVGQAARVALRLGAPAERGDGGVEGAGRGREKEGEGRLRPRPQALETREPGRPGLGKRLLRASILGGVREALGRRLLVPRGA